MEYQKVINLSHDTQRMKHLNIEQEIGLKQMINQKDNMIIVTIDLKHPW